MKRFLIIFLSLITVISLTMLVFSIKFRIERHGWVITTAEITFVGMPDGLVFGTFTDYNGKVHSEYNMYIDGRFQPYFNPATIEPYLGSTVRIMYDPSTIDLEGTNTTTVKPLPSIRRSRSKAMTTGFDTLSFRELFLSLHVLPLL